MALLFVLLSLTHGIVMLIVVFLCMGLTFRFIFLQSSLKGASTLAGMILFFVVAIAAAYSGFSVSYSGGSSVETSASPPVGEPDVAVEYHNAYLNLPPNPVTPLVLAGPPYVSRIDIAKVSAILMPAAIFHRSRIYYEIGDFPGAAIQAVHTLTSLESYAYIAALLGCCVFLVAFPSAAPLRHQALFLAATCTYLSLIVLSVYLDSISVSAFPLTAIRRTYPYSCFFYWASVAVAVLTIAAYALRNPIYWAKALLRKAWGRRIPGTETAQSALGWGAIIFACLVPLWFIYSINAAHGRPRTVSWLDHRIVHRLREIVLPPPENRSMGLIMKPLFDAVTFVEDRTGFGELVYSNVISENIFWFLSSGRLSLLDGTNMYQFYFLQRDAVHRMRRFEDFASTLNMSDVVGFDFKYLLLYKGKDCDTLCYGDVVVPIDFNKLVGNPLFERVFDNSAYAVFERIDISAGSRPTASAGDRPNYKMLR